MRIDITISVAFGLLLLAVPGGRARADEPPVGEPPLVERPAEETAQAEREAALKRAEALTERIAVLYGQGKYAEATPLAREALAIHEKAFGPDHPQAGVDLNNLAELLKMQGLHGEARPLLERAVRIWESALGPDHPALAASLGTLGGLFYAQGLYEKARPLLERSLSINEAAYGPDHESVATSLNDLAVLLQEQGLYEEARPLCERALSIMEKTLGADHPDLASGLNNLALVRQAAGLHDEARLLFERALRIWEKALGSDHPALVPNLGNLALLLQARGLYEEARPLFERALRISEKTLGADHPLVAKTLNNLAFLFFAQALYEKATPFFERSLSILEKAHGPDHPSVATSLRNLGLLAYSRGQYERARPLLERCLAVVEQNLRRHFGGLQASERLVLARSLRVNLDGWLRLAPHVGRSGYDEVLRLRGLVARASTAERRLARRGGAGAVRRIRELHGLERRFAQLANSMPPKFQKKEHTKWQQAYAKAGVEREALALALARDFAPLREGLERLDLSIQDIRAQLGPDAVLVDYLQSGDGYLAWIVRHKGEPERLELGDAASIERVAAEFATLTADRTTGPDSAEWQKAGHALRDLAWAPIQDRLGEEIRTVYLCPDAVLATISFGALPGRVDGRSLIDDFLPVHLSMAQDLVPWPSEGPRGEGAIAIGDVDYGEAATEPSQPVASQLRGITVMDRAPRGRTFAPLPETHKEVAFIRKCLGDGCDVLRESEATEARFRAESKGRRILHLATHGFVRDDLMRGLERGKGDEVWLGAAQERQLAVGHDPMNLAGLAFAGANPGEGGHGDDGILTAAEASHLDLDGVDLVVLSACQTALGKAEAGEGVIGLVRGFQMAGAKRVIASLWQVDDEATRMLMQHFYEGMRRRKDPLSPAEALREAALKVRSATGAGGKSFAAPRFWASFACYGL